MKPQETDREDPAWVSEIASKRIVYAVSGMEHAVVRKDLVYKRTDELELKADVYLPPGLAEGELRPAILFIHGGPLPPNLLTEPKEWGCYISHGQLAAVSGLVGVTFNYRYRGLDEKSFEQSAGDVSDAIAFIRNRAGLLHVDPQRICLWAFSGGGPHLVTALREPTDYIRCIVSYYAILDMGDVPQGPGFPLITSEVAEKYSPARYLNEENAGIPPVFIGRAGLDRPYLNGSVDRFISRAFQCGVALEVCNHPAGRHGFDTLDDDARSREIIARTIQFIQNQLFSDRLKDSRLAQNIAKAGALLNAGEIEKARNMAQILRTESAGRDTPERVFSEPALIESAYHLMSTGKMKEAAAVLEWALEEHPDSPGACDHLAAVYEACEKNQESVWMTEKALKLLETAQGLGISGANSIRLNLESRLKRLLQPGTR
jgi:acetyl esterase/lipase